MRAATNAMLTADPAAAARKIGVQVFRLQVANRQIGEALERLQIELETLDFALPPINPAGKRRHGIKVGAAVLAQREALWTEYEHLKTAKPSPKVGNVASRRLGPRKRSQHPSRRCSTYGSYLFLALG